MPSVDNPQGLELPVPDAAAIAHSERLVNAIVERIEQRGGVIGFDEYMQMALYEPGLGYYSASLPKFGARGDFITAPEISPLFGCCLARQAGDLIAQGCAADVLEFGAGSGKLCAQILESLPALAHYRILDLSADLRQRQQQNLGERLSAELFHKIEWLDRLPRDFDGIVLANEVLDAMPVHILSKQDDWIELGVGYQAQRFAWLPIDAEAATLDAIRHVEMCQMEKGLGALPRDYCTELNLNYPPWMAALAQSCRRAVVLIIDYGYERAGYYHAERRRGTLTCYYQHRAHADPRRFRRLRGCRRGERLRNFGFDRTRSVSVGQRLAGRGATTHRRERANGATGDFAAGSKAQPAAGNGREVQGVGATKKSRAGDAGNAAWPRLWITCTFLSSP
jgi:SAM-dependent MidA family methyltransferase